MWSEPRSSIGVHVILLFRFEEAEVTSGVLRPPVPLLILVGEPSLQQKRLLAKTRSTTFSPMLLFGWLWSQSLECPLKSPAMMQVEVAGSQAISHFTGLT